MLLGIEVVSHSRDPTRQKALPEAPKALEKVYELQALVFLALLQDILQATKHARELLSFE
jgi:hypothetical protein